MGKRVISQRHKPSVVSYIRQNFKTTFAITEKAELMVALGLLVVSAVLGFIGGLSAPEISNRLAPWHMRVAVGLTIFVVVQFLIITPFRMWRQAVWVANVEQILEQLMDYHDRGVDLLNSHHLLLLTTPNLAKDSESQMKFLEKYSQDFLIWSDKTEKVIEKLYPLEARRFKNVVAFSRKFTDGINVYHDGLRSQLLGKLNKIDAIIERHQPKILPE